MRMPGIAWMPGRIKPAVTSVLANAMDLFPTALALAGAPEPGSTVIDGTDLAPLLFESKALPKRPFFYYRGDQLFACRLGEWKAHFQAQTGYGQPKPEHHEPPVFVHLGVDVSEKCNFATDHPDVLTRIREGVSAHQAGVVPDVSQLD